MDKIKKSKKHNLILLESIKGKIILDDEEEILKEQLVKIEKKLNSFENIIEKIRIENQDTIYSTSSFNSLIGSVAIAKAVEVIEDYFELKKE